MKHGFCSARTACTILAGIAVLTGIAVCADSPAIDRNAGPTKQYPTTQYAPGFVPAAQHARQVASPSTQPVATFSDEQLQQAIARGIDFLLSNFDKVELKHVDGELGQIDHDGIDGLCVDALLQAGQAIHDPRFNPDAPLAAGMLDRLKRQRLDTNRADATPVVYARAMRAASLAIYNRPADHSTLSADVDWLIHAQRDGGYIEDDNFEPPPTVVSAGGSLGVHGLGPTGRLGPGGRIDTCIPPRGQVIMHSTVGRGGVRTSFAVGYPTAQSAQSPENSPASPTTQPSAYPWDNFDSQIALYGVSAGADAGIEVPAWYWQNVQNHWLRFEVASGQWYYTDFDTDPSIGMSFAGNWALHVTHNWLSLAQPPNSIGRPPFPRGLVQALKWLEAGDNSTTIKDDHTLYVGYNLFVLELLGRTSGFKYFGTHDWYPEITNRVLAVQWQNGSFGRSPNGIDPIIQTAYTLLFLRAGRIRCSWKSFASMAPGRIARAISPA